MAGCKLIATITTQTPHSPPPPPPPRTLTSRDPGAHATCVSPFHASGKTAPRIPARSLGSITATLVASCTRLLLSSAFAAWSRPSRSSRRRFPAPPPSPPSPAPASSRRSAREHTKMVSFVGLLRPLPPPIAVPTADASSPASSPIPAAATGGAKKRPRLPSARGRSGRPTSSPNVSPPRPAVAAFRRNSAFDLASDRIAGGRERTESPGVPGAAA